MAVLTGIAVTVVINGKDLPEYDENNDNNTEADNTQTCSIVTKYVEVTSNTTFQKFQIRRIDRESLR